MKWVLVAGLATACSAPLSALDATVFEQSDEAAVARAVAHWQLQNPEAPPRGESEVNWSRASFLVGLLAAARLTHDPELLEAVERYSSEVEYALGPRPRHADDLAIAQVYEELAFDLPAAKVELGEAEAGLYAWVNDPRPGREEWWWADALFMGPPGLAWLAKRTGDSRVRDRLHEMYFDAVEHLWDSDAHLFFRDESYFSARTRDGQKLFWSRGNGWVLAGATRTLELLAKDDPRRHEYERLVREHAEAILGLQSDDGTWPPSLLNPAEPKGPEASGTALFCTGLARGVRLGVLDPTRYRPAVEAAWVGLLKLVRPEGGVGYVQGVGERPEAAHAESTHEFGTGAFLTCAEELSRL